MCIRCYFGGLHSTTSEFGESIGMEIAEPEKPFFEPDMFALAMLPMYCESREFTTL